MPTNAQIPTCNLGDDDRAARLFIVRQSNVAAHSDLRTLLERTLALYSNIPGCESGEVANAAGGAHFTPRGGSFAGIKEFICEGGEAGFTVRLTARFGEGGSFGHWTLESTWGELEFIEGGSGSLVGTPTELGIDDHYTGYLR